MAIEDLINRVVKDKISSSEFEKIKDQFAEVVYMRQIYEEIRDGKIQVNTKHMFKQIANSKYTLQRAKQCTNDKEETEALSELERLNNLFLKSFKCSLFSKDVSYNASTLPPIIKQCNQFALIAAMRLDSNQVKEISRIATSKYNLRKQVGAFSLFIGKY